MRLYEKPEIEKTDSPTSDSIETHPAYGQIGASRVSGRTFLYGSDFEHQHFVTITIRRSELHRSLNEDRHFGHDELISVALSEAQWATFVSTLNHGMGVPCTIEHIDRVVVPGIPGAKSRTDQFMAELKSRLASIEADAERLRELIEKGTGKKEMRDLIGMLQRGLRNNLSFIASQFGEHIERVTEDAKIEIEAYLNNVIQRSGVAALKGEKPPFVIEHKKEGD